MYSNTNITSTILLLFSLSLRLINILTMKTWARQFYYCKSYLLISTVSFLVNKFNLTTELHNKHVYRPAEAQESNDSLKIKYKKILSLIKHLIKRAISDGKRRSLPDKVNRVICSCSTSANNAYVIQVFLDTIEIRSLIHNKNIYP